MVKTLSTERDHQIGNASDPQSRRCWLGLQHSVKDWVPFHFPSLICDFRQNEANLLLFPEPRAIFTWREDAHLWPNRQIWTLDWMLKCPPCAWGRHTAGWLPWSCLKHYFISMVWADQKPSIWKGSGNSWGVCIPATWKQRHILQPSIYVAFPERGCQGGWWAHQKQSSR